MHIKLSDLINNNDLNDKYKHLCISSVLYYKTKNNNNINNNIIKNYIYQEDKCLDSNIYNNLIDKITIKNNKTKFKNKKYKKFKNYTKRKKKNN